MEYNNPEYLDACKASPARRTLLIVLLVLVCNCMSCSEERPVVKDSRIEKIMEQVSSLRMSSSITDLVAFETRYPHEKQLQVAEYLLKRMNQYIPDTRYHEYEHWGVMWRNVVGTIRGKKNPEQVVIICAHMDSKSEKRLIYAAGADDNASGCAAVLEISRLLSGHDFDKTIRFVIFSREEDGQDGSKAYVKDLVKRNEKIVAAINLDMIAYGKENEDIDLVTRPSYAWLVETVYDVATVYGFKTKKVIKKACH